MKLDKVKAKPYAERVREQQKQLDSLKGQGMPLGGADPIPQGHLPRRPMPQMDYEDEKVPIEPQEPPVGVGAGYGVNQAMVGAERPLTLREAQARAASQAKQGPISRETQQLLEQAQAASEAEQAEVGSTVQDKLDEAEKEAMEDQEFDFDFAAIAAAQNSLMDPKRKKAIEGRLEPLDITDLITQREIVQDVEVIPGKLGFTFRTLSQRENIWCMKYVYDFPGSPRYVETLFDTAKLACVIVALNGKPLPDHRRDIGQKTEDVDPEQFKNKMGIISSWPVQLIADAGIQCNWFNDRVNSLFNEGILKNG